MKKKKMSLKDWNYIGQYNAYKKWLRPLCNYTLIEKDNGDFERHQQIKWWLYALIFIPTHLIEIICCIWDCGLKNFEIMPNRINKDIMSKGFQSWQKAKEIYERR